MSNAEKLRDLLQFLLLDELGEYSFFNSSGSEIDRKPAIRIVPPQVPDSIKFVKGSGIECLIYEDPRIEFDSKVDWEYYEVALRQHNLEKPTTIAKKLIGQLLPSVKNVRIQQAQIRGDISVEQVNLEIPRFYNFDDDRILTKASNLLAI